MCVAQVIFGESRENAENIVRNWARFDTVTRAGRSLSTFRRPKVWGDRPRPRSSLPEKRVSSLRGSSPAAR